MTRRCNVPVFPVAVGRASRYYRVQTLVRANRAGRLWATVLQARPAVAERILGHMRTDGARVRLVQR